jgi:hypothetical protein
MSIERIPTGIEQTIVAMASGVQMAAGSDVALYVDPERTHIGADGVIRFLPVIAIELAGGYVQIPGRYRDDFSAYFGALLTVAELRAEEINRELGLEPDDALELIGTSMDRSLARARR